MTTTTQKAATAAQAMTDQQPADRYPTRKDDRTSVFDRGDPVLHGKAELLPSTIAALERVSFFSAATNRQDDIRRVRVSKVGVDKTVKDGVVALNRKSRLVLRPE